MGTLHRGVAALAFAALSLGGILIFGSARAEDPPDDCVKALAQLKLLKEPVRVYKQGQGESRVYLPDRDRPGEIQRLNERAVASCSADDDVRRQQDANANRLIIALSVRCAAYRDELAMLQRPGSRAREQDIERRRLFVAEYCPDVSREDVWLPDRVIVGHSDLGAE